MASILREVPLHIKVHNVKYELLQSREVSDSYLLNSIVVIIRAGSIWHAADMCGNTTQCLHAFTKHGIYGRHNK